MKKNFLKLATAALFVGTILFTISAVSGGKVSMFKQAHAEEQTYTPIIAACPDDSSTPYYIWCGAGSGSCTATSCVF